MNPLENITLIQVKDTAIVLLALAGVVVLIGNLVRTVKEWHKPQDDLATWRRSVDTRLNNDHERLESMEKGNKVICRGILALLSHEINGNSVDKLKSSQAEMTDYLIER